MTKIVIAIKKALILLINDSGDALEINDAGDTLQL